MPNWFLKALEEWLWLLRLDGPPVRPMDLRSGAEGPPLFVSEDYERNLWMWGRLLIGNAPRRPTDSSAHRLPGNLLYGRLADDRRRCQLRGIDWGLSATAGGRRSGQKGSAQEIYDALCH